MNRISRLIFLLLIGLITQFENLYAEDFAVGDKLVVKAATKIMGGQESIGTASAGAEFSVEKIADGGGWLLGSFTVNGRKVSGWVKSSDVIKSKTRPAPATVAPARPAAPDLRTMNDMFQRMIPRYDKKQEFPATLYGFLPVRQGLTESMTADVIARNRYSMDYIFAQYPFDPSTIREAETVRLLSTLPKDVDLNAILEQVSQKTATATEAGYPFQPTEPSAELTAFLQQLKDGLFTDAYATAQALHQQHTSQFGADHAQSMASLSWVLYCRRLHAGLNVESNHHQVLDWGTKKYGPGNPLAARAWNNLAMVRHDRGDAEAARLILLQALQLRTRDAAAMTADIPLMLLNLSRVLESEGRLTEALRCSQVARAAVRSLPQPVRELIAGSWFDEFASVRLAETGGGPFYVRSGLPYRPSVSNFGGLGGSMTRGDNNETSSSGFDSLNMTQIVGAGSQGGYPYTPYLLAATHFSRQSDWAAAERFERKAIELAKASFASKPDLHWHISSTLQFLSMTQELTGNHDAAIETLREAIKYQRPLWEKEWKDAQAAFAAGRGEYFVFAAYTIYGQLLLLHAKMYSETNRLEEAERLYREALVVAEMPTSIDKRPMTLNTSHAPQCRVELAAVLLRRGQTAEAEKLFRSELASGAQRWCYNFWLGIRFPGALVGLADIIADSGKPTDKAAAAAMVHDAYLMSTSGAGSRGGGGFEHVINYADSLRKNGCYAEAALVVQRALASVESARRQVGGDELNRARYFSELTKNAPHSVLAQLQVEVGDEFMDHFGVGRFGAKAAFDSLEMGRGRALLDLMNRGGGEISSAALMHARSRNDQVLIQRVLQLREQERSARKQVMQVIEQGAAATNPADLARAQTDLQKARDAERQTNRDLFDIAKEMLEKNAVQPLTSEQTAAALKPDEALLTYDIGPEKSLLLAIWPDGKVDSHFLKWPDNMPVGEPSLSTTVAEYFLEVSREEPPAGTVSAKGYMPNDLRSALLPDALWERLKKCGRLYLVADGPLHKVPFESLFLDEDGDKILIDEAPPFIYGPSATVLLHPRQKEYSLPQNRLELVALGDPQFTKGEATAKATTGDAAPMAERTRSLSRFGTLSPLPGTRAEIDVIRQTLAASQKGAEVPMKTLTGADATATNLVKETVNPRFLHLATHGLAEGGRKAFDSALALAAPAQLTPDDVGFLRLSDLMAQWGGKLNGTELVVLSACRTARGEMESGDGFVALTWGFLYAGSDAVIASLWEVDDTATALLMSRLYENLTGCFDHPRELSGKTYAPGSPIPCSIALQEAKHWLRTLTRPQAEESVGRLLKSEARIPNGDHPYADPYYWAAFLFFGSDSTVGPKS